MFGLGRRPGPPPPPPPPAPTFVLPELSVYEAAIYAALLAFLVLLRLRTRRAVVEGLTAKCERTLCLPKLSRLISVKEVQWAYLNAAMIEPILMIAGSEEATGKQLVVNVAQLLGISAWIYLMTDAFDASDNEQEFAYAQLAKNAKGEPLPAWLRLDKRSSSAHVAEEHQQIAGKISVDVCLWLMLSGIFAAWSGVVTHRDVIHSYTIVIMWVWMHHATRQVTVWGGNYATTLLMPSAALLPLEWTLPLADKEVAEEAERLVEWRAFILERTGVELTIIA